MVGLTQTGGTGHHLDNTDNNSVACAGIFLGGGEGGARTRLPSVEEWVGEKYAPGLFELLTAANS